MTHIRDILARGAAFFRREPEAEPSGFPLVLAMVARRDNGDDDRGAPGDVAALFDEVRFDVPHYDEELRRLPAPTPKRKRRRRRSRWFVLAFSGLERTWLPCPNRKFARELVKLLRADPVFSNVVAVRESND